MEGGTQSSVALIVCFERPIHCVLLAEDGGWGGCEARGDGAEGAGVRQHPEEGQRGVGHPRGHGRPGRER